MTNWTNGTVSKTRYLTIDHRGFLRVSGVKIARLTENKTVLEFQDRSTTRAQGKCFVHIPVTVFARALTELSKK